MPVVCDASVSYPEIIVKVSVKETPYIHAKFAAVDARVKNSFGDIDLSAVTGPICLTFQIDTSGYVFNNTYGLLTYEDPVVEREILKAEGSPVGQVTTIMSINSTRISVQYNDYQPNGPFSHYGLVVENTSAPTIPIYLDPSISNGSGYTLYGRHRHHRHEEHVK